jgi:multiple sugar transport system substrate-binding protein
MIELKGMTWDHSRGFDPMVATAQAFQKLHPDIQITWQKRSLKEFGDFPIEKLAETFDLLVIDHPFMGTAAHTGCLIPLDEHIEAEFLLDQANHSVGKSHISYNYNDHQWALAIDAAAQVSAYRADLLEQAGEKLPETWDEVLSLARRTHDRDTYRIAIPVCPIDSLMSFFSICASTGEVPCQAEDIVVSRQVGEYALAVLQELVSLIDPICLSSNPIQIFDMMGQTDDILYCPLLFGYSNYGRQGYRENLIAFTNVPKQLDSDVSKGGILGGTGFAISYICKHIDLACEYGKLVASSDVQTGLYFDSGGQPGHRSAWLSNDTNSASNQFFKNTLETLDHAYLRPRYHGFMEFQDRGWNMTHSFLKGDLESTRLLDMLDDLYRQTLQGTD